MGGKSTPDAPDYRGAAEEQAQSGRENLNTQTWANRPTMNTPWGQSSWNTSAQRDPATGQMVTAWENNLTLTPEQQQALDYQQGLQTSRSGLAAGLYDRLAGEYANPVDWSNYQEMGTAPEAWDGAAAEKYRSDAEDAIYGQWARRAEPQMAQQEAAVDNQLRNQGLRPGTEAYDYQKNQLMQQQADARQGAQYQATIGSGAEAERMMGMDMGSQAQGFGQGMAGANYNNTVRQQQIAEEMMRRGYTLNEVNAILTGQQVGTPQMPGFNAAGVAAATDYSGAASQQGQHDLDTYNAKQASSSGMMGGLGDLAGGIGALAAFSDPRLKKNINYLGKKKGYNWYKWEWNSEAKSLGLEGEAHGVLAHEVQHIPGVVGNVDGYSTVNYRALGV